MRALKSEARQEFQVRHEAFDQEKKSLMALSFSTLFFCRMIISLTIQKYFCFSLKCEKCIYVKSYFVLFKISVNKSPIPFSYVHTYV